MTLILQAVELFGEINENEKLQYVRLFGGLENIRKSFENRKPLSLELNHNSNIMATYSDNNNYALKLKRRRKLIDGKWHYQFKAEIIGSIPLTARFRSMADFTSNLPEPTFLDSLNEKIFSDNINESITALRNIQLPKKADHLQFIENRVKDNRLRKTRGENIEGLHNQPIGLIQPPVFYRTQVFNNYLYQNKLHPDESIGVNKATGQPYKRLVSRNRAKVDSGFSIAWDHYPVPTSTTKEASDFIKHFPRKDLLERLESLFNERPCWTRAALMNQFTPQEARFLLNQKLSVTVYSYSFHSGPFADTLCRIGWDPRLDSGNRVYQRIQTRILGINERRHRGLGGRASGVNAVARASTATPSTPAPRANSITRYFAPVNTAGNVSTTSEHSHMELNSESHIFDGKHTPEATNFQICDIHDEDCKKLIADEQGHSQMFDYVTGFFTTEQVTRIRGVLKRKIIVLKEENRQLTEEELAQLLIPGAMQNDSDEETTQQTPLASKSTRQKARNLRETILSNKK